MTPNEMAVNATIALQHKTGMILTTPRPWKNRPPKFPRGELLAWLAANGLITVVASVSEAE